MKTLRGITHLYPNAVQIVVRADSNISSVKELKGKKIVPGLLGSATEINAREVLSLYGLDYYETENLQAQYVDYAKATVALTEGRVDGILIAGGLPTKAIIDAASSKIHILSLEPDLIGNLISKMPWYYAYTIPKGAYKGQAEDVLMVAVANLLVCRENLKDEFVYSLTKTIYNSLPELVAAHVSAKDIELSKALHGMTIPLHPGAKKFFRENGIIKKSSISKHAYLPSSPTAGQIGRPSGIPLAKDDRCLPVGVGVKWRKGQDSRQKRLYMLPRPVSPSLRHAAVSGC